MHGADDEIRAGALCDLPIPSEHRLPPSRTVLVAAFTRGFVGHCYAGRWVYDELDAADCLSDFVGCFGGMIRGSNVVDGVAYD